MKKSTFAISLSIILISIVVCFTAFAKESVIEKEKNESYGVLVLTSQMPDLTITIDEEELGLTQQDSNQSFAVKENGTSDWGHHEIVLSKDINSTHEWYFRDTFSFSKYVDVQKFPKQVINIFTTKPEQKTYPPVNFKIYKRMKPAILAKKTGLIKEIKLQHNRSWHMSIDDTYIYVITTASDGIYSIKNREKNTGEFLEIYDINTYELKQHVKLGEETGTFSYFKALATDENFIYIGTQSGDSIYYDNIYRSNVKVKKRGVLNGEDATLKKGHSEQVSNIKIYDKNLFTISEDGTVGVYEIFTDNKYHLRAILNTKKYYPKSYLKLEDKRYGHLFDLVVHKNIAYISSDIGVIFKFDLNFKTPKFIGLIDTIAYDAEYKQYIGSDIKSMQIYKDRYLMFATEYRGLSMYDALKNKMIYEQKNLYPKETGYSELFKEEFDATKTTDIYKFLIYKNNIVFTEVNPAVLVYSLDKEKIIHKFLGINDEVSDIKIDKNRLFALSSGEIYIFDLNVME